jgi:GT2 family glycosyltransferase
METMTKKPRLAIIMPFINTADYVIAAVKSIKTKEPYILILIDNGSNPDTVKALDFLSNLPNTYYVRNEFNLGVAASWNYGVKKAKEIADIENFLIINSDILFHGDCIDRLISVAKNDKYALVSACDVAKECSSPNDIFGFDMPVKTYEVDRPNFSCFLINSASFDRVGAFDEHFYPR